MSTITMTLAEIHAAYQGIEALRRYKFNVTIRGALRGNSRALKPFAEDYKKGEAELVEEYGGSVNANGSFTMGHEAARKFVEARDAFGAEPQTLAVKQLPYSAFDPYEFEDSLLPDCMILEEAAPDAVVAGSSNGMTEAALP